MSLVPEPDLKIGLETFMKLSELKSLLIQQRIQSKRTQIIFGPKFEIIDDLSCPENKYSAQTYIFFVTILLLVIGMVYKIL